MNRLVFWVAAAFLMLAQPQKIQAQFLPHTGTFASHDTISLLTEGPSADLYTKWGHIAIRVKNNWQDNVYGFGTFDFETSWFAFKFIQGSLLYTGSKVPFVSYYQEEMQNRHFIVEQVLNLSQAQTTVIENELIRLNSEKFRFYKYDFLRVNCSTKIRDILINAIAGSNLYSKTISTSSSTFRQYLNSYLVDQPWLCFGVDLVLGMPVDKKTSEFDAAFLPINLYGSNKHIGFSGHSLVKEEHIISRPQAIEKSSGFSPLIAGWILLIVGLLLSFLKHTRRFLDVCLFSLAGILGLVIFYLVFISEHSATKENLNLIWANPLLLFFPISRGKTKFYLAILLAVSFALFLASWSILPQYLNPAVLPIVLLLFFRALLPIGLGKYISAN